MSSRSSLVRTRWRGFLRSSSLCGQCESQCIRGSLKFAAVVRLYLLQLLENKGTVANAFYRHACHCLGAAVTSKLDCNQWHTTIG
jgi:hypothetical protein